MDKKESGKKESNENKETIQKLEKIINEQQKVIELLKERLTELADDHDKLELRGCNYHFCDPYRTSKWKW
jgi:predicted RNase H-like nuclease (RuvC/YqgF family)